MVRLGSIVTTISTLVVAQGYGYVLRQWGALETWE